MGTIEAELPALVQTESFCAKICRWIKYVVLLKAMKGSSVYEKINKIAYDRAFMT